MEKQGLKKHFKLDMLHLDHKDPQRFVHGPWRRKGVISLPFLLYRIFIALLMICGDLYSTVIHWAEGKWFIYLTHWGFLILAIEAVYGAIIVIMAYVQQRSSDSSDLKNGMPISYKIYWIIYNIAITSALFITVMYWTLIFDPNFDDVTFLNIMVHALNLLVAILQLMIVGPPTRFLHFIHPLLFGIVYMAFNVIYWAAGGTDEKGNPWVYEVLDWSNPGLSIAIVFGSAIGVIVFHIIILLMAGGRSNLTKRFRSEDSNTANPDPIWATPQSLATGNINKSFEMDTAQNPA